MKKYLFIICGSISLLIGLCGLFIPGLPTTPFILLTGALYTKSSPKLYKRLEDNKLTGMYLNRMKAGISWKVVLISISLMWCMVCLTAFLVFDEQSKMRYIMLILGAVGTIAQLIVYLRKRSNAVVVEKTIENPINIMNINSVNE